MNGRRLIIRNHGGQQKEAQYFSHVEKERCQHRILCLVKISFQNEGELKPFLGEGKLRICHQHTNPKRMANRSFLRRNEMIEGTLEHQEGRD